MYMNLIFMGDSSLFHDSLGQKEGPLLALSTSNTIVELNMKKKTFLTEDSANLKKRWYLPTMLRAVVFNLPQH